MSSIAGLLAQAKRLRARAQVRKAEAQDRGVIRYWIEFVAYCSGEPEAKRRFGSNPRYHRDIERFLAGVADDVENWARENPELAAG